MCAGISGVSVQASDGLLRDSLPERWSGIEATLPSDDSWWRGFEDPLLDSLISEAERANYDLAAAALRMDAARRQIEAARAQYYPQIGVSASYTRERNSGETAGIYAAGASVSWEIDIFGRIREAVKERKAQYRASRAEWTGAMQSICAQVATAYIGLRTAQAELAVAQEHILRQDTIAGIARSRYECGLNSKIDLDQALGVLYSTRAAVPTLQASITSYINAISLLLGNYGEGLAGRLAATDRFPEYRRLIAAGVPSGLLRRRPDVVAAECDVAAAAAALGIARKDYLPTLSVEGSVGVSAPRPGDMFTRQGFTYSVAPTLSWTVFDGMARRAATAAVRDAMQEAVAAYNGTVINAYMEVENAIAEYTAYVKQIQEYERCVDVTTEFLNLSLDLYTQGLAEFTRVADAQADLLNYSNSLTLARGGAMNALVTLYKALGGGIDDNN